MSSGSLLIYAPVPLYRDGKGGYLLEDQACNGLRLWAENFDKIIALMPVEEGPAPARWVPVDSIGPARDRIDFVPLPVAWRLAGFLRHLPSARARIRAAIAKADRMGFAIGGLVGEWAGRSISGPTGSSLKSPAIARPRPRGSRPGSKHG